MVRAPERDFVQQLDVTPPPTLADIIARYHRLKEASREYAQARRELVKALSSADLQAGAMYNIGDYRVTAKPISGGGFYVSTWDSVRYIIEPIPD